MGATGQRGTVKNPKGILAGLELTALSPADLRQISLSPNITESRRSSFYAGNLADATFQGITFIECNFARSLFENVRFSRCKFQRVDFTRATFSGCFFSETTFVDCDPYYSSFDRTEINPSVFRKCFRSHNEWNKALILFSDLRRTLKELGETRASRTAEYYFRIWQRRRLYHRWHFKRDSELGAWLWSLFLGALNGYGERPIYLAAWAFGVITLMGAVYKNWFPYTLATNKGSFYDYWFYSFKVFFAQGLSTGFQGLRLGFAQVGEFVCGVVMVSLLIASISRKLSP